MGKVKSSRADVCNSQEQQQQQRLSVIFTSK
jgi:hypothetical protein